jgi:hypothetical protein
MAIIQGQCARRRRESGLRRKKVSDSSVRNAARSRQKASAMAEVALWLMISLMKTPDAAQKQAAVKTATWAASWR